MKIKPCTLWEIVGGCETFEGFCNEMVPSFQAGGAPFEIQRKLEVIQKLIIHSYYEYDFIDVALDQTFHALEMGLHLKYQSLYPNKSALKNLKPYLDWAVREGIILPNQSKTINELRNHLAHPKKESIIGMAGIVLIKTIIKVISDLFDNPNQDRI